MSCEKTIFPAFIRHPQPTGDRGMGEKRKRVEIENGHDGVYPLHREELTSGCSANNRTVVGKHGTSIVWPTRAEGQKGKGPFAKAILRG